MPARQNAAFEYAKKISDYFAMALRIGIGAGAAFGLWELAGHAPETSLRNEIIAVIIGLCTTYLAAVFIVAVFFDLRGIDVKASSLKDTWFEFVVPIIAFCLLISLVYFARTTATMMM